MLLGLVRDGRVPERRLDESAARLLAVKFRLGLFDDPYVSEDLAEETVGRAAFRAAGRRAQSRSVTVLSNHDLLPLTGRPRIYAEGVDDEAVDRVGTRVGTPEEAELAIVRVDAPFEPRSDLFLENWFHQGGLDFTPGFVVRMQRLAGQCPLLLDVTLDRPAVLTPLVGVARALTASYGTSDVAYGDAVTGVEPARGRLPFDLPRSMDQVRAHPEDVSGFDDPLFAFGHGLPL